MVSKSKVSDDKGMPNTAKELQVNSSTTIAGSSRLHESNKVEIPMVVGSRQGIEATSCSRDKTPLDLYQIRLREQSPSRNTTAELVQEKVMTVKNITGNVSA